MDPRAYRQIATIVAVLSAGATFSVVSGTPDPLPAASEREREMDAVYLLHEERLRAVEAQLGMWGPVDNKRVGGNSRYD